MVFRPFLNRHVFKSLGLTIFTRFSRHGEGGFEVFLGHKLSQVLKRNAEKLFPVIYLVYAEFVELLMKFSFKCWRVVATNHSMDIEFKRH